ncbi:MAG: primosomal protein N' [Lentisphaerae bacterium]|nr:primosomal protein N' [Lentisphaerota bacterium]
MPAIAKVTVDRGGDKTFDYRIPAELAGAVRVGSRVTVPFGRARRTGYVVGLADRSERGDLKAVAALADREPFVGEGILKLARWMADYYGAPLERAVRTVLPGVVRRRGKQYRQRLHVRCAGGPAPESGGRLSEKQKAVLDALEARGGGLFLQELTDALGISDAPVKALARKGLVRIGPEPLARTPAGARTILPTRPLKLMREQEAALEAICTCIDGQAGRPRASAAAVTAPGQAGSGGHVVLLYGVTGSGKTEVYLQAIGHVLERGQGAIVLVPEISLTPQTVERFRARFGDRIAVLHSHLSEGERHDEWHRIRDGKAPIVVGARSAVFAPVRNPGLIVVDEEHEGTYKQDEAPRYHARDVAVMRGRMEGCAVVLGSATPSLESWHNASTGKYRLAVLPHRADNRTMPPVRVVDMRVARSAGRASLFSRELLDAIRQRLDRAEQVILFLNRRGFATSLVCPKCGEVLRCDRCSVSYTYHRSRERMVCHICGGTRRVPARCPGCGDPAFRYAGAGTQRLESALAKCFPQARLARMDADSTAGKDAYHRILGDVRTGTVDILIGTQMIAKGLHFPNVTLVGVVYADLSLHLPDFRAGERTFQLLAQVAGRAGRGEMPGEVIVQTYTPFHPAVQAARRLDYEGFCAEELAFRRELDYPPFTHLVNVGFKGKSENTVAYCASLFAKKLQAALGEKARVSEGAPAPLARAKGAYRYQVMARAASGVGLTRTVRDVLAGLKLPRAVTVAVDVDAVSLL